MASSNLSPLRLPTGSSWAPSAWPSRGSKGRAAFFSYLKQPKVIARLEAEGFERAGPGAPAHPWYLRLEPGVVEPGEKALCRALTSEQRARIEERRIAALERRRRLGDARGWGVEA